MTKSKTIAIGGMLVVAAAGITLFHTRAAAQGPGGGGGPYSSQPLALSWDDTQLAVVNPDVNTVSIFAVQNDQNVKVSEIPTGKEPWGVAFSSDGTRVYVANRVDGTISVISQGASGYGTWTTTTIPVGTEPFGIVQTASGNYLYVTNIGSGTVSVIDTRISQVVNTISNVGPLPRGIAITHGAGLADSNQVVYVTNFLALPAGNGVPDGFDNAKAGFVTAISVANNSIIGTIQLQPVANTGFDADGDALQGIAPPATPVTSSFTFPTGAYPNQLNTIATKGNFAYIPNTAASPDGPVRFNVNVQALVNVINVKTNQDAGQTINMQSAVKAQTNPNMLFLTQPWAVAFENYSNAGFVVSAASNVVAKLAVDPTSGAPSVQLNPSDTTSVLEIPTGRNPRGIVINSSDTRAYVMNYISRDVTVISLSQLPEKAFATMSSTAVPTPGTTQNTVQIGKELFNTSVGIFDASASAPSITGRMSNLGWGSCASCHPEGLSDNVVWIFASGPRRTVPLHATFAPGDTTQQRALNWSAIFDQIEDFEGNIRNVSGGLGMFVQSDGVTQATLPAQFSTSLAGLPQLTVRGVGGWNAIKAYVQSGIRAPISPASKQDPNVLAGQQLFIESNCQSCHGTSQWTASRVTFTPPPNPSLIQNTEIIGQLDKVGTFNPGAGTNEVRATAVAPLGADGFNPPTLLSLFAFPQTFFHNGSAATLDAVLSNVTHRTAGTGGVDFLTYEGARTQLIDFLLSIDSNTTPISPQATLPIPVISKVGNAFGLAPQIAPNTWVAIVGTNLAPDTRIWQSSDFGSNQLPTQLDGVSVTVNGQNAYLYYISPTQINILTPPNALSGSVPVQVIVGNVKSNPVTVPAQTQSISFFQFVSTVNGLPYIYGRRASDSSLIGPTTLYPGLTTPVQPGAAIYVAGTGFGTTTSPIVSGALSQGGTLPTPWPVITIGGVTIPVTFAGLIADGTYQFNFTVPANTPNGDIPISATYNGLTTQPGLLLTVHN